MRTFVALLVLGLVVAPASANLLSNGNFDADLSSWSWTGGHAWSSTIQGPSAVSPQGGGWGSAQNGDTTGTHLVYQTVDVSGLASVTLTGYIDGKTDKAATDEGIYIFAGAGVGGTQLGGLTWPGLTDIPQWSPVNVTVSVSGQTQVTVAFGWRNGSGWGTGSGIHSDGLNLTPEPASLALLGLAGIPFLRRRR